MSNPDRICFSVIVPCYNQGHYLYEALASVRGAATKTGEVIIVDDGSTDPDTLRLLKEAPSYCPNARVIHQSNRGLAAARLRGISEAQGRYIQLLDSDDLLAPGKIDAQVDHIDKSELDLSISGYATCDEYKYNFALQDSIRQFSFTLHDVLFFWERGYSIPIHSALFRAELFRRVEFRTDLRAKEDWVFWAELMSLRPRVAYLSLPLAVYRLHSTNMTRSKSQMAHSWFEATKILDKKFGVEFPDFAPASLDWLCKYYLDSAESPASQLLPLIGSHKPGPDDLKTAEPALTIQDRRRKVGVSGVPRRRHSGDPERYAIIIPVFNHADHLAECIVSACTQTFQSVHVFAMNDRSTDPRCTDILNELAASFCNLTVCEAPINRGIAATQNELVEIAANEYIGFLDCDDYLSPHAIEEVNLFVTEEPGVDYFFSDRYDIMHDGRLKQLASPVGSDIPFVRAPPARENDRLLFQMFATHLKVIKRSAIFSAGGFDATLSGVQDWDLALRISERGRLHHIPRSLYFHRLHTRSVTHSRSTEMIRKTNRCRLNAQVRRGLTEVGSKVWGQSKIVMDVRGLWDDLCFGRVPVGSRGKRNELRLPEGGRVVVIGSDTYADEVAGLVTPGESLIAFLPRSRPQSAIDFLRDYNSFFGGVLCENELDAVALQSYCYEPTVVQTDLSLLYSGR